MMTLQAREWSNRTPQLTNKPTEDGTLLISIQK